jgi:hypothetical protein
MIGILRSFYDRHRFQALTKAQCCRMQRGWTTAKVQASAFVVAESFCRSRGQ